MTRTADQGGAITLAPLTPAHSDWARRVASDPCVAPSFFEHRAGAFEFLSEDARTSRGFWARAAQIEGCAVPVGYIDVLEDAISFFVAPEWQGRHVGRRMVSQALEHHGASETLIARVQRENLASRKVMEAAGFRMDRLIRSARGMALHFVWTGSAIKNHHNSHNTEGIHP